jgi:hypothetical protein
MGVGVGGTDVLVGGTDVSVGGIGVSVGTTGVGVWVGVSVAAGVFVPVDVGNGVGGIGVIVKVGNGVRVGWGGGAATGVLVAQANIVKINTPTIKMRNWGRSDLASSDCFDFISI